MPRKSIDPAEAAVRRFGRWVPGGLDPEALANLDMFLQMRSDYLGADPYTWNPGDLRVLLLEVFPRKVQSDPSLLENGPGVLGQYLRYLEESSQLRGSAGLYALQAELEEVTPQFAPAMNDSSRFGMAKSLFAEMSLDGLDLEDEEADDELMMLAPVVLAPEDELRELAAAAPLVQRVSALWAYIGHKGRQVTQTGALRIADAKALASACGDSERHPWQSDVRRMADLPGVSEAYELAVSSGLLDVVGTRVERDPAGVGPLKCAESLATVALELGVFLGEAPYMFEDLADAVSEELIGILGVLYGAAEPVPVDDIIEELVAELDVRPDFEGTVRSYFERCCAGFERLGMLTRFGTSIALTPLGLWWLQRLFEEQGVRAPVVGGLAQVTAAELCEGLVGYPIDEGQVELAGWRAHRGDVEAARQLAGLLASTDVRHRQFALHILDGFPDAEVSVRPLLDDEVARPSARVWLVSNGFEVADEYHRPEDDLRVFVDAAGLLVEMGASDELLDALGQLSGPKDPVEMVRQLWRVDSPMTEPVLNMLAAGAPPAISKAARKALHSLRSARATVTVRSQ